LRGGTPCGIHFCLHGPRATKFSAIWETDQEQNRFIDGPASALLYMTQNLPIGDEDGQNTQNPGRHLWLSRHQEQPSAIRAVVGAFQVPILLHKLTTMRAVALHGLIPRSDDT
jgi:hypothetical protein